MSRFLVFVIILLIGANGYTWHMRSADATEYVSREAGLMVARDSLEAVVRALDARVDSLRAEIHVADRRVAETRLSVSKLRRKSGLESRFRASYPPLADAQWGLVDVYDERSREYVEYLLIPAWISETFIIDHENARLSSRCLSGG